ncbi:MAG: MFS transporter [Paracoccaceae bacterium]
MAWRDRALRLVLLAIMLTGVMSASVAPYQSLIAIEIFGMSDRFYSVVLFVAALIGVSASIAVGIWTDQKANRRIFAVLSALLLVTGGAVLFAVPNTWTFVAAHAVIWPLAFTLNGQLFALARLAASARPAVERDAIMGAIRAMFALPFIVVLPLWALALSNGVAILNVYGAATLAAAICFGLVWRNWPEDGTTVWKDRKSGLSFTASLVEIMTPRILVRVLIVGSISAGTTLYMILTALLFNAAPGRGAGDTALFVGIVAGLEVPFMLWSAVLLRRFSKTAMIAVGALIYAVFLSVFAVSASAWWIWFLTVPAAIGAGITLSVPIAYLQDLIGDRPGAGGSLIALNQVTGQVVAAAIFALGTTMAGYVTTALVGAVVVAVAGVALVIVDRR